MTKQEKIRRRIAVFAGEYAFDKRYKDLTSYQKNSAGNWARMLTNYLHSERCRIEVDRELPQVLKRTARLMGATYPEDDIWKGDEHFEPCPICGQAGYVATIPIIEEIISDENNEGD